LCKVTQDVVFFEKEVFLHIGLMWRKTYFLFLYTYMLFAMFFKRIVSAEIQKLIDFQLNFVKEYNWK